MRRFGVIAIILGLAAIELSAEGVALAQPSVLHVIGSQGGSDARTVEQARGRVLLPRAVKLVISYRQMATA